MNYLFTAAGEGSRFIKQGIKPPKPLIKVFGDELLIWSMRSFSFNKDDNVYIVTRKTHKCQEIIKKKISRIFTNINIFWLEIDHLPNGQLMTAIIALENFKLEGNLIVHNCDTAFEMDARQITTLVKDINKNYAFFPVFEAKGDHWSFAETMPNSEKIIRITEKERISSNCSIGTYIFNSASEFLCDAKKYIKEIRPNKNLGEYYISPFLNYLCNQGKEIKMISAKNPKLFGNLDELLENFEISFQELISENSWSDNQRKTLVVDIDGTICGSPKNRDYSKCEPISSVVDNLIKENNKGTYIILFTARNMRTFKGSIGLINKYTAPIVLEWLKKNNIPFDEIIFGKPWGQGGISYVDDKNIDPFEI